MIVSARVSERMTELGLSQSELARRVGVAQPTIYKLLKTSKKGSTHLHKIARELQTTPAYLSGETDDPTRDEAESERLSNDDRDLLDTVRQLKARDRDAVRRVATALREADTADRQVLAALSNERALTSMFEAMLELLDVLPDRPDLAERARLLAHWLPTGLSQLRDLLPAVSVTKTPAIRRELAEALAIPDRGSRS